MKIVIAHIIFELPDDFKGSSADALKLMSEYTLENDWQTVNNLPEGWQVTPVEHTVIELAGMLLFDRFESRPDPEKKAYSMVVIKDLKMLKSEGETR